MEITSEQLRAARAYLHIPQTELARKAHVSIATLRRLEADNGNLSESSSAVFVQKALEAAGIEFVGRGIMPKRNERRSERDGRMKRVRLLLQSYRRKVNPSDRLTKEDLYDENGLPK